MTVEYGTKDDIFSWMELVSSVSWNFPGLETEEKLKDHENTVLRFMSEGRAPRRLYKSFGFVEGELIEEFGYPNQQFILSAI